MVIIKGQTSSTIFSFILNLIEERMHLQKTASQLLRAQFGHENVPNNAFSRLVLPYLNFAGNLLKALGVRFSILFLTTVKT